MATVLLTLLLLVEKSECFKILVVRSLEALRKSNEEYHIYGHNSASSVAAQVECGVYEWLIVGGARGSVAGICARICAVVWRLVPNTNGVVVTNRWMGFLRHWRHLSVPGCRRVPSKNAVQH